MEEKIEPTPDTGNTEESGQSEKSEEQIDDNSYLITEEDRKKYSELPEKFKDWKSVIAWGSEAEKAKSKAEMEKSEYERQIREYEEMIAEMQSEKEGLPREEKEKMLSKFREDWETDPVGTLQKFFDAYESKIEAKLKTQEMADKWHKEEMEILKDPEYKKNWDSEIRPALYKIAKERPHLNSIEEVLAIYERQKAREKKFNDMDSDKKKTERKEAFSESGGGVSGTEGDLAKKIASAKNMEELEKLASKIK
ncbi:MAG: hypothetical protein AB1668_07535 [Nanoarchaeota archaeon]